MISKIILYLIIIYLIYLIIFSSYVENFENNDYYQLLVTDNIDNQYILVSFSQLNNIIKTKILSNNLLDVNLNDDIDLIMSSIKTNNYYLPDNDTIFAIKLSDLSNENIVNNQSTIAFSKSLIPYYVDFSLTDNKTFTLPLNNNQLYTVIDHTGNNILTITLPDETTPNKYDNINLNNDSQLNNLFINLEPLVINDSITIYSVYLNNMEQNIKIQMIPFT